MKVDLGSPEAYSRFPALVEIGSGYYYLTPHRRGYILLSTLCPHAGGEVLWESETEEFVCPLHGWRFDRNGKMDNRCEGLKQYRVKESKGRLWVDL